MGASVYGHTGSAQAGQRGLALAAPALVVSLALLLSLTGSALAAPLGQTNDFATPTTSSGPEGIAAGPEGNLWFTERSASKIGVINPVTHATSDFATPTASSIPAGITVGPEGNLWFTEEGANKIGEINPLTHATSEFATPTASGWPFGIAAGPEGNLWFTERAVSKIGVINPITHATSDFATPTASSEPVGIAVGPEGNLWFMEANASKIGEINPVTQATADFATPTASSSPFGIAAGPDGNLWFTEVGPSKIGEINPVTHATADFATPTASSFPRWLTAGPDGNIWFTEEEKGKIGEINPVTQATADFATPTASSAPFGITVGPDGNLWFAEYSASKVGFVGAGVPEALVSGPVVSGGGQAGAAQLCSGASWSSWASLQPSASLFSFDGYRWLLDGSQIATGQSYTPGAANIGHELSCAETVTYPLLDVTSLATSAPITVVAPPSPLIPTVAPAPAVTSVHQSASRWREGNKLAQISRKEKKRPPVGTTFSFSLNEQASVSFTFTQRVSGRKVGHKCVAKSRKNAKRKSCKRTVTAGTLSFSGHGGTNKVVFKGRISRSKRLKPGSYTLEIEATNTAGQKSEPQKLSFTIVK